MNERTWFYLVGDEAIGPISEPVLSQLAVAGHLFAESYVWTDGMSAWTRLDDLDEPSVVARSAPAERVPEVPSRMTRMLLPVGRSGWAIAAGYLGLVSVLLFPAPIAIAAGVTGLREIRRNDRLFGRGRAIFGIVMGSVFTVVLGAGILALALG